MTAYPDQKSLEILLQLDPDKVCHASSSRAVGEVNLLIIGRLVRDAICRVPNNMSNSEIKSYTQLTKQLKKISEQFKANNYNHAPIAKHIETLSQKLNPFKKEIDPLVKKMFKHPLIKKIIEWEESDFTIKRVHEWKDDLTKFFKQDLIPSIYALKTSEQYSVVRSLLKKIVKLKKLVTTLDEEIMTVVKHFVFNSIKKDPIYFNLLHYQEGSLDLSHLGLCQEAAESINAYMLKKLIPFLKDPDIRVNQEEIIKIYWNLSTLHYELMDLHAQAGALLFPTLQSLEKFI